MPPAGDEGPEVFNRTPEQSENEEPVENFQQLDENLSNLDMRLGLVVCDMQEGNRERHRNIWEKLVRYITFLEEIFNKNYFPIIACEDPDPDIGHLDPRIKAHIYRKKDIYQRTDISALSGGVFNCLKSSTWIGVKTVIVVGVEAHIAVEYTAKELAKGGYNVIIIDGIIGSANEWEKGLALTRLSSNCKICCTSFDQFLCTFYGDPTHDMFYNTHPTNEIIHPILLECRGILKLPKYYDVSQRDFIRDENEPTGEERFTINFFNKKNWEFTIQENPNIVREAEKAFELLTRRND